MARTPLVDGIFDFKSQGPPSTFSEIPVRGGLEGFPSSHVNVGIDTGLRIGYPRARDRGSGFLSIPINFIAEICISLPRYAKRVSREIRPNSRIESN